MEPSLIIADAMHPPYLLPSRSLWKKDAEGGEEFGAHQLQANIKINGDRG